MLAHSIITHYVPVYKSKKGPACGKKSIGRDGRQLVNESVKREWNKGKYRRTEVASNLSLCTITICQQLFFVVKQLLTRFN